jgi:nucleotide-binding universal stress UspA family protein
VTGLDCILVPLDGSESAEAALDWAYALPAQRIRLLRVCPEEPPDTQAAAQYLEEVAARFRPPERRIETRIAYGGPAETIVDDAADSDLIVMSTQSAGGGGRLLFGSVADRVARHAPAPTLLLRGGHHPVAVQPVRRIVTALDGSLAAERALPMATLFARELGVPIHLVSVSDQITSQAERGSDHGSRDRSAPRVESPATYLERTAASLGALDVAASTEIRCGPAALEVMATLGSGDLLIITTHGQGAARRWQIGNVAEKLLRQAAAPVVLVRADTP